MSEINEPQKEATEGKGLDRQQGENIKTFHDEPFQAFTRFPLVKIILASLAIALFLGSVSLNLMYAMSESGDSASQIDSLHWVLILGLIIVATVSLVIAFWAHYARSIYLKDGPALAPERLGKTIGDYSYSIEQLGEAIGKLQRSWKSHHSQSQETLVKVYQSTEEKGDALIENFLRMQGMLDNRDKEIERLKKGYDTQIFKRFLVKFIHVYRDLCEMEKEFSDPENQNNYQYLKRLMWDALEECGVEEYTPEIGTDYRGAGSRIADHPKTTETKNADQAFKIAEIESDGYIVEGEEETVVIVPARVSVFRFDSSDKEGG